MSAGSAGTVTGVGAVGAPTNGSNSACSNTGAGNSAGNGSGADASAAPDWFASFAHDTEATGLLTSIVGAEPRGHNKARADSSRLSNSSRRNDGLRWVVGMVTS